MPFPAKTSGYGLDVARAIPSHKLRTSAPHAAADPEPPVNYASLHGPADALTTACPPHSDAQFVSNSQRLTHPGAHGHVQRPLVRHTLRKQYPPAVHTSPSGIYPGSYFI